MSYGNITDYDHSNIIGVLSKAYKNIFVALKGIVHIVHIDYI